MPVVVRRDKFRDTFFLEITISSKSIRRFIRGFTHTSANNVAGIINILEYLPIPAGIFNQFLDVMEAIATSPTIIHLVYKGIKYAVENHTEYIVLRVIKQIAGLSGESGVIFDEIVKVLMHFKLI